MNVLLSAVLLVLAAGPAPRAHETVVVMSSDLPPYREAYEAFAAALGSPVALVPLGERTPRDARVIVAIGGKAASRSYPADAALIHVLAPGARPDRSASHVEIDPPAELLLRRLTALQPGLKTLAVLWSAEGGAAAARRLHDAAGAFGVSVRVERVEGDEDLPGALRRLRGRADALWLPADPLLINARNFEIIKGFAYANDVPFYAPTEGLAEKGAVAAVSVGFAEAGRAAAAAAREALAGRPASQARVGAVRVVVNRTAAAECGLSAPEAALRAADKVLP